MTIAEKVEHLTKVLKEAEANEEVMRINYALAQGNTKLIRDELKTLGK